MLEDQQKKNLNSSSRKYEFLSNLTRKINQKVVTNMNDRFEQFFLSKNEASKFY